MASTTKSKTQRSSSSKKKQRVPYEEKVRRLRASQAAHARNEYEKGVAAMDLPCDDKRIDAVFGPIEATIDAMEKTGEMMAIGDTPAFQSPDGEVVEFVSAVLGMADTYSQIVGDDNVKGIVAFAKKVDEGEMLIRADFKRIRRDFAHARAASRQYTPNQMKEFIRITQFRSELEALGLGGV